MKERSFLDRPRRHPACDRPPSLARLFDLDALIVTMALKAQCRVLYSEDMQDGRVIDGLRIENPFKPESA
jgi:predicted nucleic acid-binding protein